MAKGETLHLACPVCSAHFQETKFLSPDAGGEKETDFMPLPSGGGLFESVATCLSCGYSGYESDFRKQLKDSEKREFVGWDPFQQAGITNPMKGMLTSDQKFYLAYLTKKFFKEEDASLGEVMLRASWAARCLPEGQQGRERISTYRSNAIEHYKITAADSKRRAHDRMHDTYLVAELSRREELFDQAIDYFGRFFSFSSSNQEWMHAAVRLQELAMERDAGPRRFSDF